MKDLHLHLSGATSPEVLWEIVRESGFKTGAKDYWEFERTIMMDRSKVKDLDTYLKVLRPIEDAQSSPMAIETSVYNAYRSSFLTGCTYLELRWDCVKRSQRGRIDLDSLIVAARAGYEKAKMIYGIHGGMILCLGRDSTEAENEALFKKTIQYNGKGIIGIDIAGPEKAHIPDEFVHYFKAAEASNMITTCHIGETPHDGEEDEMAFVLEKLQPQRIGHGVQMAKYPKLLKRAAAAKIHFEVCISSNLVTRAVDSLEKFKEVFKAFEENGIEFSINTDAIFPLNTNIKKEHELLRQIKETK